MNILRHLIKHVSHSVKRQRRIDNKKFNIFMIMTLRTILLLILMLDEISAAGNDSSSGFEKRKSDHRMALAWAFNPIFGLIGTCLNSFILYMFYTERQTFIKPINAMIW